MKLTSTIGLLFAAFAIFAWPHTLSTESAIASGCPPVRYGCLYLEAAHIEGVATDRLIALAMAETRNGAYLGVGTDYPVSRAGAIGIMQVMPSTSDRYCPRLDQTDVWGSIRCGARVLAEYERRVGADLAIAAYNAGPGAVERWSGAPPYRETGRHARNFERALREFRAVASRGHV